MLAILTVVDYEIIAGIVLVASGIVITGRAFRSADRERLTRVETKLNLLLKQAGLEPHPEPGNQWQTLASNPARKLEAITEYRRQYGVGLAEAKKAVEDFMAGAQ